MDGWTGLILSRTVVAKVDNRMCISINNYYYF